MATINKNAISVLNEMAQKGQINSIEFHENGNSGPCHEPTFKIMATVICNGKVYKSYASAANKKTAKTLAAAAVLQKLGIKVEVSDTSVEYSTEETAVSILNRMSQQCGFTAPVYTDGGRKGPDHEPTFKIVVKFRGKEATGSGASKKIAKENAAIKLLRMI